LSLTAFFVFSFFGVNLQQAMQVHKRKASAQTYEKAKLKVSHGLQQQQEFVMKLKLGRVIIQNTCLFFFFFSFLFGFQVRPS
jgi:hypothetical protein